MPVEEQVEQRDLTEDLREFYIQEDRRRERRRWRFIVGVWFASAIIVAILCYYALRDPNAFQPPPPPPPPW